MVAVVLHANLYSCLPGVDSCTGFDQLCAHSCNDAGCVTVQAGVLSFARNLLKSLPQLVIQQVEVQTCCWSFARRDEIPNMFGLPGLHSIHLIPGAESC